MYCFRTVSLHTIIIKKCEIHYMAIVLLLVQLLKKYLKSKKNRTRTLHTFLLLVFSVGLFRD
jgi:hypothetical protein